MHGRMHAGAFYKEMLPGDQLVMHAQIMSIKRWLCKGL